MLRTLDDLFLDWLTQFHEVIGETAYSYHQILVIFGVLQSVHKHFRINNINLKLTAALQEINFTKLL